MIAEHLINAALPHPYFHLEGYMQRWWLVPYKDPTKGNGCGPVSFWRRPLAWLLQQLGIVVRVHRILRSDNERHLHDHPFASISILLRGSYIEVMPCHQLQPAFLDQDDARLVRVERKAGHIVTRAATDRHRLELPNGECWSVFVMWGPGRDWGFHTPEGWVHWKDYDATAHQASIHRNGGNAP